MLVLLGAVYRNCVNPVAGAPDPETAYLPISEKNSYRIKMYATDVTLVLSGLHLSHGPKSEGFGHGILQ